MNADVDTGGPASDGFANVLGLTGTGRAITGSALGSSASLPCSLSREGRGSACGVG